LESVKIPELKVRINKLIANKIGVSLGFELWCKTDHEYTNIIYYLFVYLWLNLNTYLKIHKSFKCPSTSKKSATISPSFPER
jgi:hypothetical protein